MKKQKDKIGQHLVRIKQLENENKILVSRLKTYEIYDNKDYQQLAIILRQERMLNKTRNDQQTLMMAQMKKRIQALETLIPEDKRADVLV